MSPRLRNIMLNTALVVFSVLTTLVTLEGSYRAYLRFKYPERFGAPLDEKRLPAIGVYDRSLWEFDAASGYRYARGEIVLSHVDGGQVTSCQKIPTANEHGNMGRIKRSWGTADLKIAVFGDSFSAFVTQDNMTWPNYLEDLLEERLGRTVSVVNFGRDGIGILQMFDMVRAKIPDWKPDMVIIAFITDDLARARFWRTANVINGEPRVLTVPGPTPQADPFNSYDTFILHPEATLEWCNSISYKGYLDRIGNEILDKYRRFRQPNALSSFSVFTLTHSYVYARIVEKNAFASAGFKTGQRWIPRLRLDDYVHDDRMVQNIRWLKETGTAFIVVHLPIYPEVRSGNEYLMDRQSRHLLGSLTAMTGREPYRLLEYVTLPVEQPERMNVTSDNFHPSRWGMQLYAHAVAQVLLRNGLVKSRPNAAVVQEAPL